MRVQNELLYLTLNQFGTQTISIRFSKLLWMWKVPFKDAMFNNIYNRFNSMAIILARCFVIYPWLSFFMFTTCDISIYLSNNIYRFATTTPCHFFEYFGEMADKSNGVEGVHLVYLWIEYPQHSQRLPWSLGF